ncbi:flagellar basal body-associated FliL family protein [bacterium]|nr:flagellar basal body-associated FliL family protein [bacterium]
MAEEAVKPKNKMVMWVVIGIVVIIAEILLSYVAVTKFLMPKPSQPAITEKVDNSDKQAQQDKPKKVDKKKSKTVHKPEKSKRPEDPDFAQIRGIYTLSDFVINPANSNGKHFFVLSAVFAFDDKSKEELIKKREPILKDKLISVLGRRTFEWFGENKNRDVIRGEMVAVAQKVLECSSGIHVYFTKYVLQ